MTDLRKQISALVRSTIETEGYELVDMVVKGSKNAIVLQFFIGGHGEITVEACAALSRKLSDLLDRQDAHLDIGSYRLEVSSPGLGRPLRVEQDFRRKIGRQVGIRYQNSQKSAYIEGSISAVQNGRVMILVGDTSVPVDISTIEEAKLRLPF